MEHLAVIFSFLELLFQLSETLIEVILILGICLVPPLYLVLHLLFHLLEYVLLVLNRILNDSIVVRKYFIHLDHHDLEQVICNQCRRYITLVLALDPHELLNELENLEEEGPQILDLDLKMLVLAHEDVPREDLVVQEVFNFMEEREVGLS